MLRFQTVILLSPIQAVDQFSLENRLCTCNIGILTRKSECVNLQFLTAGVLVVGRNFSQVAYQLAYML